MGVVLSPQRPPFTSEIDELFARRIDEEVDVDILHRPNPSAAARR
jgi:hypothetical protein